MGRKRTDHCRIGCVEELKIDPQKLMDVLGLEPLEIGGHCAEVWAASSAAAVSSLLLQQGEEITWHRADALRIWHHQGGAPVTVNMSLFGNSQTQVSLGIDVAAGQRPYVVIPVGAWTRVVATAPTLLGVTSCPGRRLADCQVAYAGWEPGYKKDDTGQ
jgi:predicted cupin superfamily sugar epimerase